MLGEAANTSPSAMQFVPKCYKTQEMCDRAVSEDPFHLKYGFDRHKTQGMCDITVDDFLPALKFVPDWFVTGKIIKKLHDALFSDDDIL